MWSQQQIKLSSKARGFHLVTHEVVSQLGALRDFQVGLAHFFMMHTSASLTINENACADVRLDMESHFNESVPENAPYYLHTYEGPDDMPAHIKSSLLGVGLTIPVRQGGLAMGTWQGIYQCEHRDHGGSRKVMVTIFGEGLSES